MGPNFVSESSFHFAGLEPYLRTWLKHGLVFLHLRLRVLTGYQNKVDFILVLVGILISID